MASARNAHVWLAPAEMETALCRLDTATAFGSQDTARFGVEQAFDHDVAVAHERGVIGIGFRHFALARKLESEAARVWNHKRVRSTIGGLCCTCDREWSRTSPKIAENAVKLK